MKNIAIIIIIVMIFGMLISVEKANADRAVFGTITRSTDGKTYTVGMSPDYAPGNNPVTGQPWGPMTLSFGESTPPDYLIFTMDVTADTSSETSISLTLTVIDPTLPSNKVQTKGFAIWGYAVTIETWGIGIAQGNLESKGAFSMTGMPDPDYLGIQSPGLTATMREWSYTSEAGIAAWGAGISTDPDDGSWPTTQTIAAEGTVQFKAFDSPVPELPPGAMQMMVLMFGSALTWVKMRMR